MLKRNLAVILLAGLVLGGGAVAWAHGDSPRPTVLTDVAAAAAVDDATGTTPAPATDATTRRQALQKCLADAGITRPRDATAEQRQKAKQCLTDAGFGGALRARQGGAAGILGRTVHGSLIIKGKDGQFKNVSYDRGKESSHPGDTLVIARPDGKTVTVKLTSSTKYRGITAASQLQDGRPTVVVSDESGSALLVGQRSGS